MHITKYTDCSRRVLVLLAVQVDERLVGVAEIGKTFQISRNHLGSI
jgi:DNA-binding IscR family transcriptional regulator